MQEADLPVPHSYPYDNPICLPPPGNCFLCRIFSHIFLAVNLGILGVVLLLAFAPFQLRIFANKIGLTETGSEFHEKAPLSNLLKWYERPQRNVGVPDEYFNFKDVYGYWVLPLLLLGVGLIIWRRNSPDTLMIAYLITMYLFIHLENIGFPRAHRFLEMEAWLFAPLIVIALLVGGILGIIETIA